MPLCCSTAPTQPIKLTYFAVDGLAAPSRIAAAIAGLPFEDDVVPIQEWAATKSSMKFKTVPQLQHGDLVLGQSYAILKYIGTLGGLYPKEIAHKIDEIIECFYDIQTFMRPLHYGGSELTLDMSDEEKRAYKSNTFKNRVMVFLEYVEAQYKKSKTGFLFDQATPTIADIFYAFAPTSLYIHQYTTVDELRTLCPNVVRISAKIESLPSVVAYRATFDKEHGEVKNAHAAMFIPMLAKYNV